ncbi:MAG: ChbG/HpnK family deacetylase [Acidimicrobiia bacterium]|nr:ChbG/HpnK family deacetylase [Acidimicrobiia bacterium]
MSQLTERLGRADDARLLIISADLLGSLHAANVGVYDVLRNGAATTATLAVPCHWARAAAHEFRGDDVGVHLTLCAPLDTVRWGPITHAPSLLDGDGGFPRTAADLWDHADLEEVRRECRAQVERAVLWGFRVTHLSTHLNALQQRPEFFDVYLDLGSEFGLPLRLESEEAAERAGFPFRQLAAEEHILMPDHFHHAAAGQDFDVDELIEQLEPGVTEVHLEPAIDTPEIRAADPSWPRRVEAHRQLMDPAVAQTLERAGIETIGYAPLAAAQQRGS